MLGTHDLPLFILSGLLLNLTPGPDTLYIVGRSTTQGWRAGTVAALGIGAGIFVHIGAAAVGLSALLAASSSAFTVVKLAGAAYLVYVGISLVRSPIPRAPKAQGQTTGSLRGVFVQGFFTNVLNPKVALFFVAFLPQFVEPEAPSKAVAFLLLGAIFNFNGTLWNLFVAWSSARIGGGLVRNAGVARWFNRCVGGLFVWLGFRLAISDN
ncbi:MAG TPA: LysE family translocator [Burkholderiales bacterium]|nr:LysE family translocator [Burkholderiales bacterium]